MFVVLMRVVSVSVSVDPYSHGHKLTMPRVDNGLVWVRLRLQWFGLVQKFWVGLRIKIDPCTAVRLRAMTSKF